MPSVNEKYEQECEQAIALLQKGQFTDAVLAFNSILKKDPKSALAWNNRGLSLLNLGHPFDAVMNIEKAIALAPEEAAYYNNKGAALFEDEDAELALDFYNKAVELKDNFPEALNNRGNALKYLGKMQEAAASYREAIKVKPDYADAHLHLSFAELALGNYDEGWKEFEWRWECGQMPKRGLPIPAWNGEFLGDKKLLLYGEQGHGDNLQFIRYANKIKQRFGGKIYVEVRLPLARLAKTVAGVDEIVILGQKVPESIDFAIPMLSAPRILGTTVDNVPWDGPYFTADKYRADLFRTELKRLPPGLLVGVCWAGMSRPGKAAAESVDRKRSTTLQSFAPLAEIKGISWVSLQKGSPSEQVMKPPRGMTIGDWTNDLEDFADTAALIECLDLVISVDTAVVHLAAALGKPTWLLSRWDGCWRWLGNRTDSPWYPHSIRQFVQPAPGDWDGLMKTVSVELQTWIGKSSEAA